MRVLPSLARASSLLLLLALGCGETVEDAPALHFTARDCERPSTLQACFELGLERAVDREGNFEPKRFNLEAMDCTRQYQEVCVETASASATLDAVPLVDLATCIVDEERTSSDCLQLLEVQLGPAGDTQSEYRCALDFVDCDSAASDEGARRSCQLDLWSCAVHDWPTHASADSCDAMREAIEAHGDPSLDDVLETMFTCYTGLPPDRCPERGPT